MAVDNGHAADLAGAMITSSVPLLNWVVILPVAVPIFCGAVLLMVRHQTRLHPPITVAAFAAVLVANIVLLARVVSGGPIVMTMGSWLPPFGISFAADALGASFSLVATLVGLMAALFAGRDIGTLGRRYGFYPFMLLMMGGVGGSFLTGDIFNLYVWFEVFLIASFGMLVLGSEREQLDGAMKYAIFNLVGTTLFLTATAYLYGVFGTLNMADVARTAPQLRETGPLMTLAVLYLFAFGMKAAAFPVNFWLPASYHTPRIVTAALFGGVLTKVGIYALLRTLIMLFPPERAALSGLIAWVAAATMIFGIMGALAQTDLRRILGFVVISGVGIMIAGMALGTETGVAGTVLYAFHSMFAITALYLLAGLMKDAGGSFSLRHLGGLYREYPFMAAIALLLVFASAGLPPGSGLWPKVLLVKASVDSGMPWLALAILATGILTTLALGRVFILAFWRPRPVEEASGEVSSPPGLACAVVGLLCVPVLAIGVYPEPFITVARLAAAGLLDPTTYIGTVFPGGPMP